ncbi:hypothetical protein CN448_31075 [Bacillus cereus]|uniref:hypothetical protein n=1 Tax=Bacillus cereus TaxID=1396 RepID=UPI000BF7387E|nr:hypothetical protein [Bacillus cereus]PEW59878.1 hypothetical protein CN448_31075 [Bacillus cereus]
MFTEDKIQGKPIYKLQYLGETVAICSRNIWGRWEIKGVVFNFYISAKTKYEAICLFEEKYKLFLRGERV